MEEASSLLSFLSDKSVVSLFALDTPEECAEILLDPLGETKEQLIACASKLSVLRKRDEALLNALALNLNLGGIIFLSPTFAQLKKKNVIEIRLLGEVGEVFCKKCGHSFPIVPFEEVCPYCGLPLLPKIQPLPGDMGKRVERAVRTAMSSDALLVLGNPEKLLPGALIPWVSKLFGGVELAVVSRDDVAIKSIADLVINKDPLEIFGSIEEKRS